MHGYMIYGNYVFTIQCCACAMSAHIECTLVAARKAWSPLETCVESDMIGSVQTSYDSWHTR